MSAPHADDRHPTRPEDRRNGHPAAGVLDGPALPQPRPAPGPVPPGPGVPGPRVPAPEAPASAVPAPRVPASGVPAPGATELTGPVDGSRNGPHTPPMPWPAVPAPVPDVFPAAPPAGGGRRVGAVLGGAARGLGGAVHAAGVAGKAGAARLTGRLQGLAGSERLARRPALPGGTGVRDAVGHRTAAIAVGATLTLAVGGLVAAYSTSGPGDDASGAATPAAAAPVPAPVPPDLVADSTAADAAAFGGVPAFTSPSGNIACRIDDGGARCDVQNRRWSADDAGCADPGLVVGAAGARASCDGAPVGTGAPELDYGTHLTRGDVTCVSRRTGVECRDAGTGHGFAAARASYRVY